MKVILRQEYEGLGEAGAEILNEIRGEVGLPVVTEVMHVGSVELVASCSDMLQIGTRNMQNYAMLEKLGQQPKPVLLKRGMMSTIEEWLMSAEYILSHGNYNIMLCERGIRTFERYTRNTLDLAAVRHGEQGVGDPRAYLSGSLSGGMHQIPSSQTRSEPSGHAVFSTHRAVGIKESAPALQGYGALQVG